MGTDRSKMVCWVTRYCAGASCEPEPGESWRTVYCRRAAQSEDKGKELRPQPAAVFQNYRNMADEC